MPNHKFATFFAWNKSFTYMDGIPCPTTCNSLKQTETMHFQLNRVLKRTAEEKAWLTFEMYWLIRQWWQSMNLCAMTTVSMSLWYLKQYNPSSSSLWKREVLQRNEKQDTTAWNAVSLINVLNVSFNWQLSGSSHNSCVQCQHNCLYGILNQPILCCNGI